MRKAPRPGDLDRHHLREAELRSGLGAATDSRAEMIPSRLSMDGHTDDVTTHCQEGLVEQVHVQARELEGQKGPVLHSFKTTPARGHGQERNHAGDDQLELFGLTDQHRALQLVDANDLAAGTR